MLGRNFSADEDRPGGEHVVLISQRLWQERFSRNPSALGQALTLNGAPYTIIGVLPEAASAFPLDAVPDLGAAAGRSALSRAVAVEQRRLLSFRPSRGCGPAFRSSRLARR